jgi:energy-coupling factor transport system substrate-specific component
MFTAGWAGMSAPLCRPLVSLLSRACNQTKQTNQCYLWSELLVLMVFGALWGLLYGAIINLWSWPYIAGPSALYWQPGAGWLEAMQRYGVYYMVTSFMWDLGRSLGNVLLILAAGGATLRALRRFKQRFGFSYQPMGSQAA